MAIFIFQMVQGHLLFWSDYKRLWQSVHSLLILQITSIIEVLLALKMEEEQAELTMQTQHTGWGSAGLKMRSTSHFLTAPHPHPEYSFHDLPLSSSPLEHFPNELKLRAGTCIFQLFTPLPSSIEHAPNTCWTNYSLSLATEFQVILPCTPRILKKIMSQHRTEVIRPHSLHVSHPHDQATRIPPASASAQHRQWQKSTTSQDIPFSGSWNWKLLRKLGQNLSLLCKGQSQGQRSFYLTRELPLGGHPIHPLSNSKA